jgi:hypothetical protein
MAERWFVLQTMPPCLLKHAACRPLACTTAAFHLHLFVCLARPGFRFLGTLAVALRAMGNVLPAGAEDVIVVFFLDVLIVFKRNVAVATKKSSHIHFRLLGWAMIDSETKLHHQHDVSK